MKKYISLFRMRFIAGLQYRAAFLAGIATQFAWGFMNILLYKAFYSTNPTAAPMTFEQLATYMWLRQGWLLLLSFNITDQELLQMIVNGNVATELCRPTGLYGMWLTRTAALRLSLCVLRSTPVLLVTSLLPGSLALQPPPTPAALFLFLLSLLLGFGVVLALNNLLYFSAFYTLSTAGMQVVVVTTANFLTGSMIPLNFLPERLCYVLELLPFSSIQNVPLRIYTGNISGEEALRHILLQLFWLAVTVAFGYWLAGRAVRRTVVQGG